MPRFKEDFTEDEISVVQEAVTNLRNKIEADGEEKVLDKLDTICEKLGNWS